MVELDDGHGDGGDQKRWSGDLEKKKNKKQKPSVDQGKGIK